MPVSIKTANLKYKNSQGQYVGVNTVGEATTVEQIAAIEAKGEEVLESIPADYSALVTEVNGKANKVSSATGGNFAALDSTGNLVDSGHKHSDYITGGDVAGAVSDWLEENVSGGSTIAVDSSLTVAGAGADAKKTGDEISSLKSAVEDTTDITLGNIPIASEAGYIRYATGVFSQSANWNSTGYIDVSKYKALIYKRPTSTSSGSSQYALVGMSFYSSENESGYISGQRIVYDAGSNSSINQVIQVPASARYARFSKYPNDVFTLSAWYNEKETEIIATTVADELVLNGTSEAIEFSISNSDGYINATTGAYVNSANWKWIQYIDVSIYKSILYTRPTSSISPDFEYAICGMAFYSDTNVSSYISGQKLLYGDVDNSIVETVINVPEGAKYARFTARTTDTAETFKLRGFVDNRKYTEYVKDTIKDSNINVAPYNNEPSADNMVRPVGDYVYLINGTNSESSESIYRVFRSYSSIPNGIKKGGAYKLKVECDKATRNSSKSLCGVRVISYINDSSTGYTLTSSQLHDETNFVLPENSTGFQLYIYISANTSIDNMNMKISITQYNADDYLVNMYSIGLDYALAQMRFAGIIGSSLNLENYTYGCFIIPTHDMKKVIFKANATAATAVAMLRDAPQFGRDVKYTYLRDEYGDIVYEDGQPVEDRKRYVLARNATKQFGISDDCKYLYFHSDYGSIGSAGYYLPQYLEIDGKVIVDNREITEEHAMHTVFFDDFNESTLSDKWTKITCSPNSMLTHDSMYYTDDEDCYISDGCLVLKVMHDANIDLGGSYQYDPSTGEIVVDEHGDPVLAPRRFKSGYVSTHDSFAIKKGAISARIKVSHPIESSFAWTFFTFSQNAAWPIAPEFDIIEGTIGLITSPYTTKDGTVYPIGSIRALMASHTHYQRSNNTEGVIDGYAKINMGDGENNETIFRKWGTFDETEWNVYKVAWDEASLNYYINDKLLNSIDLTQLDHASIFTSPADVRINVKSRPWSTDDEAFLMVDWVKVESETDMQPPYAISHEDMELTVGQNTYLNPTFTPSDTINRVYNVTSSDPSVVYVYRYLPNYYCVYNQLRPLKAGTATITMTTADGKCTGTFTVTVTSAT